jgi:DNA repair exonuclease SbcCD ATPase subunit
MSIKLKTISVKNFLSVGQVTQSVDFDRNDLTLILGINLDLGGDGARNGTGKTTLIQALHYALFGSAINNIRKDNLVNRTNAKHMMVTLDFDVDGKEYRIIRGRKPNILKFYVNNEEQGAGSEDDAAQGENKETQAEIERILKMSPDMFRNVVALNTYSEPFLAMKAADQRSIIEQLLGITLLSEKADKIKELVKATKDEITTEEVSIRAAQAANQRVQEQIDALKRRQKLWIAKHREDLAALKKKHSDLNSINIEAELSAHKQLVIWNQRNKIKTDYTALVARQTAWSSKHQQELKTLNAGLDKLTTININYEIAAHSLLETYLIHAQSKRTVEQSILSTDKELKREQKTVKKVEAEIAKLHDHKCYACGQEFHDSAHTTVLDTKMADLKAADAAVLKLSKELEKLNEQLTGLIEVQMEKPVTHYATVAEAHQHKAKIDTARAAVAAKQSETNPFDEQITELESNLVEPGSKPVTHYDTEAEAVQHNTELHSLVTQIATKESESDPYSEQITEMESSAIVEVSFDTINELTKLMDHQKFLLDLLSSKDSFVRKRIIDQNLSYLNSRLTHYLEKIGLPHQVTFLNDLTVEITELGREMDFHNMSRGEMNRLILSLSWAFRDVFESLFQPVNVTFIDELLDNGTDTIGVENSMTILKDMVRNRNKSIWLISHREELVSRVNSTLKVIKENGFTNFLNDEGQ